MNDGTMNQPYHGSGALVAAAASARENASHVSRPAAIPTLQAR